MTYAPTVAKANSGRPVGIAEARGAPTMIVVRIRVAACAHMTTWYATSAMATAIIWFAHIATPIVLMIANYNSTPKVSDKHGMGT